MAPKIQSCIVMYWNVPLIFMIFLYPQITTQIQYLKLNISKNEEIRKSLSMCIVQACKRYFNSSFETVTFSLPLTEVHRNIISGTVLNELVLPVLEADQRWAFVVKGLKESQIKHPYIGKSLSYIIQIRREEEFEENIKRLERFDRWNPHAKFLVVSPTVFSYPYKLAVDVIKTLWNHTVVNAAVLLVDNKNTTNYNLYSWKPYSPHSCGNNFTDVLLIDSCSFGVTSSSADWFANKIPKKVLRCPVKVKYLVWPPFIMGVKHIAQVKTLC